jgi:hypothetical protein
MSIIRPAYEQQQHTQPHSWTGIWICILSNSARIYDDIAVFELMDLDRVADSILASEALGGRCISKKTRALKCNGLFLRLQYCSVTATRRKSIWKLHKVKELISHLNHSMRLKLLSERHICCYVHQSYKPSYQPCLCDSKPSFFGFPLGHSIEAADL